MDSVLFEKWAQQMDRKFTRDLKKIALIIDNYTVHLTINNLISIEFIFLRPNTTSKLHVMDHRVIFSIKVYCKSLALQMLVAGIDKGKDPRFFYFRCNKNP